MTLKSFIKFCITGIVVNLSSISLYYFLIEFLNFSYQLSWLLYYIAALWMSFILNNYITFENRSFDSSQFYRFLITNVFIGILSLTLLTLLIEFFYYDYLMAMIIVIFLVFPISFLYQSLKIFNKEQVNNSMPRSGEYNQDL